MIRLSEITDLFAALALHLRTPDQAANDGESIYNSISHLNQSLNLKEDGRTVSVLDTALSLMCFKAPQVFIARVEYTVRTIQSVLSNLINCRVLRIGKKEVLQIGASIPRADCLKLMEALGNINAELERHGIHSSYLLYTTLKVAVSARRAQYSFPYVPVLDIKPCDRVNPAVLRLLHQLPEALLLEDRGVQFRLMAWYVDPTVMKNDILKIMQDVKKRPFLCLSDEFHQTMDWRCTMTCLVLSPAMFIEATSLLHKWFLLTGLASVLKLRIQLISSVLDLLSRPTWWGISMDLGIKLPFLRAYFPHNYNLLRTLAGQLSYEGFARLILIVDELATLSKRHSGQLLEQAAMGVSTSHKSIWAMAIVFPGWFLFASALLFYNRTCHQKFQPISALWSAITEQSSDIGSPSSAAARYISWILSPHNKIERESLGDCVAKISESWTRIFCSGRHDDEKESYRKNLKRLKVQEKEKITLTRDTDSQKIALWLEEFQDIFTKSSGLRLRQSVLFRRILLGILLVCSNHLTEDAFEILLHYTANSEIVSSHGSAFAGNYCLNSEESASARAIAGACLVFDLTAAVKILSDSLFETEEAWKFLCLIKGKSCKYLCGCIKKVLQLEPNGGCATLMLRDLRNRLVEWKSEGMDSFLHRNHVDDAITELGDKLSSL